MGRFMVNPGALTVGVAAHGNVETTVECLNAIFDSLGGDFELLLVDDKSPDDMLSLYRQVARIHPNTRIYHFDRNLEYSQSVNCILSESRGERVLFVSNDIMITPHYVIGLIDALQDDGIGIARGVSNFVDNGLKTHNVRLPHPIEDRDQMLMLAREIFDRNLACDDDPFLIGDAFMTSRALLNKIGGFDTRYIGYLSDFDFGIRAVGAGFRRVYVPRAFAWHAKDANFAYLDDEASRRKLDLRWQRVRSAWTVFRDRWNLHQLPEDWPGVQSIPLGEIDRHARERHDLRPATVSYAQYLVTR